MRAPSLFQGNQRSLLAVKGIDTNAGMLFCGLSLVLHIVFFAGVLALQDYSFHSRVMPPSIQVSLVSLSSVKSRPKAQPAPAAAPEPDKKAVHDQEPVSVKAVEAVPETGKTVVVPELAKKSMSETPKETAPAPVPVKKESLKSKTFKPSKVLDNARKAIEANVEKESQDALEKALARIEQQVQKSAPVARPQASVGVESEGGSSEGSTRAIDLYNLELMYRIQQNWAFNERLAGADNNIQVRILIKILKNGELRDVWFETRSGNKYLDESALKAIKKSNPMPALPAGYLSYDVGLIFTPSGLK
ncbi:MAG: TonB family protein [Pseudomonadota bacterium]